MHRPRPIWPTPAPPRTAGITVNDIQAVLIGIAPVAGTPKVVAAGGNILAALGFEIMVAEPEMAQKDVGAGQ
jgi:hypothetical protein